MYEAQRRNRSSRWRSSLKKVFLKFSQNSQENTCAKASNLQIFLERNSGTSVFHEVCELFKNTFIYRTPLDDCLWRYFFFGFSLSGIITDTLKQRLEVVLQKRCTDVCVFDVFWIVQSQGTLTKLGALLQFCLFTWNIDVLWIVIWRENSKHPGILVIICILFWNKMVFLCSICLLPEKMTFFFIIINKQLCASYLVL